MWSVNAWMMLEEDVGKGVCIAVELCQKGQFFVRCTFILVSFDVGDGGSLSIKLIHCCQNLGNAVPFGFHRSVGEYVWICQDPGDHGN